MTRATFTIPTDLWVWLRGYAAARRLSRSRTLCDILTEKRLALAAEARESQGVQRLMRRFHPPK